MRAVRNVLFLGSALALTACGGEMDMNAEAETLGQTGAPLMQAAPGLRVDGAYIIKVKDGADARAVAAVAGVSPRYAYSIINGFAATLTPGQLTALRQNADVEYVEEDAVVTADATQYSATWGIDRIDQRALPLSGSYTYTTTASTVYAYIIDTGLQTSHSEFATGRASNVYDAFGGTGADCHGHGTHVGGTVGGVTYGVAKAVKLRGVRVLDCNGSGTNSGVIAGMDWVRTYHTKPAVANMSLGGGYSSTVNTSANNLANAGVFLAVAAGNNSADACNYSPASAAYATTVGSTTSTDARSSFSNFGTCVDIYGPGSSITSAALNGTATTMSGTSMASPHVAGVGALYKATYGDAATSTIDSWLKTNGTALSYGKLLYKGTL
jgi:subtilisin family serine protease